jgi:hypothetical protein
MIGRVMKIESIFDFSLYTVFTIGVLFVLVPMGINFTVAGVKSAKLYGLGKFPEHVLVRRFGKSAIELLFVGIFALVFSVWYLFIDQGGHLRNYISEASQYLQAA